MSSRVAQVLLLLALAAAWGFGANALRPDPLPLRGAVEPPPPPEAGADLPAAPAEAALSAWESGAFFVDVRDPAAFTDRHVSGALSIPAADFDAHYFDVVASLGPEVPLLVYGAGADSFDVRHVAQELKDRGHTLVDLVVCGAESLYVLGLAPAVGEEGMP